MDPRFRRPGICAILCALPAAAVFAGSEGGEDGKRGAGQQIYQQTCQVCHETGVNGAPRPNVADDWVYRLDYGVEDLYLNVIEGLGAKMPPRGACAQCTDEQLQAAVDYMLAELNR